MKRALACSTVGLALSLLVAPASTPLSAQIGIGVRAGTAGLGADVGFAVADALTLRAGLGFLPLSREVTFSDLDYNVEAPPTMGMVGVDLNVLGPLRLMGGLLWRSDDITFDTDISGSTTIGGTTYTSTGTLNGALEGRSVAPYLGLGVGRLVGAGIGVYAELAAAFMGDPTLTLDAEGPITQMAGFSASLEAERQDAEDDIPEFARYWPILSIGLRFPLGGR